MVQARRELDFAKETIRPNALAQLLADHLDGHPPVVAKGEREVDGGHAALAELGFADSLRNRPFVVDVPRAYHGNGRVILFSNNPIYRWQNHGEFNMVFNSILNGNDVVAKPASATAAPEW